MLLNPALNTNPSFLEDRICRIYYSKIFSEPFLQIEYTDRTTKGQDEDYDVACFRGFWDSAVCIGFGLYFND